MNNYKSKLFSCGLILLCVMLIIPIETTQTIESNEITPFVSHTWDDISVDLEIVELSHTFNETTEWGESQTLNYTLECTVDTPAEIYDFDIKSTRLTVRLLCLDGEQYYEETFYYNASLSGSQEITFLHIKDGDYNETKLQVELIFRASFEYLDDEVLRETSTSVSTIVDVELQETVLNPGRSATDSIPWNLWFLGIVGAVGIFLVVYLIVARLMGGFVEIKSLKLDKKRLCDRHPNDPECQ